TTISKRPASAFRRLRVLLSMAHPGRSAMARTRGGGVTASPAGEPVSRPGIGRVEIVVRRGHAQVAGAREVDRLAGLHTRPPAVPAVGDLLVVIAPAGVLAHGVGGTQE